MSELVPITQARARLSELIRRSDELDIVLMNHGRPAAILVSAGRYNDLLDELEDLRDRLSIHERAGITMPLSKLIAELGLANEINA